MNSRDILNTSLHFDPDPVSATMAACGRRIISLQSSTQFTGEHRIKEEGREVWTDRR